MATVGSLLGLVAVAMMQQRFTHSQGAHRRPLVAVARQLCTRAHDLPGLRPAPLPPRPQSRSGDGAAGVRGCWLLVVGWRRDFTICDHMISDSLKSRKSDE